MGLPPDRFCNYIYHWLILRVEPEKRPEMDYMLERPFGTHGTRTPRNAERDQSLTDEFLSVAGLLPDGSE